ncbi:DedA family protein [Alicyclobacillus dauci]|uniref:DedA family protein n=1 Tax=Alicyclobacillus dauci TaxID=1475485 RepID=A0ABY6YYZ7_9BACL|nr:DedA family protein [Alicyclobacillus dauci]WAH35839.1 DedA family protein [Alicyclobacillus dauci]
MGFQHIMHQYGYFGVFMIIFIEAIGFPFPAETTLTLSGIEWTQHVFKLFPLWLAGCLGNIVGSTIAYFIGRLLGRPIVLYLGKYIGITAARLDRANEQFQKYELVVIVVAKFIAGIRILVPYLAGINRMKFWVFWPLNAVSAVLWSGAFIIAGHYIGEALHSPFIHRYMWPTIIVAAIIVAAVIYFEGRSRRRRKQLDREHAERVDGDSAQRRD